jgi:hypothetical protein
LTAAGRPRTIGADHGTSRLHPRLRRLGAGFGRGACHARIRCTAKTDLNFNDKGVASVNFVVGGISVSSDKADGIIGRAVIVHADVDDFKTDPTGNADGRLACGVIR